MKLKLLFSTAILLMIFNTVTYAQSSASESGIAIQGIAKDANNAARIGVDIILTFEFYYKDGASNISIVSPNKTVTTDDFGIFSTIVDPGVENNGLFSNNLVYLKISEGATVISDEKLKHVPYAISANNGVPTGSIMPFIGADAPAGWALCDGSALPATATNLIAMIGASAPDLRGMFMRGAGTSNVSGYEDKIGPGVNVIQDDSFENHNHSIDPVTSEVPSHQHNANMKLTQAGTAAGNAKNYYTTQGGASNHKTGAAGGHSHVIPANTGFTPSVVSETRPVNYGVNYIIKL